MNFIKFESKQKLRGGFYTDLQIATFLVKWIKNIAPKSLLEPSCGDGIFFEAIQRECIPTLKTITACELDPEEAQKARLHNKLKAHILNTDFLRWYLFKALNGEVFDAVVGNPPYIRYQYLPEQQQLLAEKIFTRLGLPFTKHTNAWVPFVLASINLLRPGGRLAMVIPSEIFHIPHAQSLRRYLAEQCSRILIYDPEEIWFHHTLQGTVLLLTEKKRHSSDKGKGVAVISVTSRQILSTNAEEQFTNAPYMNGAAIEAKWMPVFLSSNERGLLSDIKMRNGIRRFSDIASVDVGIVTGANDFFLVPDKTVEEYDLHRWAHPMFGRGYHVQGLIYSKKDHKNNKKNGLPSNFLWFQEEEIEALPAKARQYLMIGLNQKLHTRFKCRTRKVWFKVPSVYFTPIGMLKRAHHYPRLLLNRAGAFTTDTAYRILPKKIKPEALVLSFVNSLTCLTAEMEGRHYGGGVLELVPSEIERLLVPIVNCNYADLNAADRTFRRMKDNPEFLRIQDKLILGRVGLTKGEQESLYNAWLKLRNRRHRVPSLDHAEDEV